MAIRHQQRGATGPTVRTSGRGVQRYAECGKKDLNEE